MSAQLSKETFDRLVDEVLIYNRTPRKELFEYPYNAFESRDIINKAEALVRSMTRIIEEKK